MTATLPAIERLTIDEFVRLPNDGTLMELVRGRIVRMTPPSSFHGYVCVEFIYALRHFLEVSKLGRLMSNDSGVITETDPDTVRGPDVIYRSFATTPTTLPRTGYVDVPPDLVAEVRSPGDRWPSVLAKVSEYLTSGIKVVVVLDPATSSAQVYRAEGAPQTFGPDDTFTIADVFPGFAIATRRFFD